jgi:hypothetical protein
MRHNSGVPRRHDRGMTGEAHPHPATTPVEREVAHLLAEIFHESANRGLFAYRLLVSRYLPWIARSLVHRARRRGMSWAGIGRILGISRQAVQKRFDREASLANMLPPTLPMKTAGADREYRELLTRLRHMREHADAAVRGELGPW